MRFRGIRARDTAEHTTQVRRVKKSALQTGAATGGRSALGVLDHTSALGGAVDPPVLPFFVLW